MNRVNVKENFYFWENLVRNNDNLLFGGNDKRTIGLDSLIMYIEIIDIEKDIFRSGWSCHDDLDTALGFLQHVFLPTCFYTWIDRRSEGLFIPMSPFDVLKKEVLKDIDDSHEQAYIDSKRIENFHKVLENIWELNGEEKNKKILEFCQEFNSLWYKEEERKMLIRIFKNPMEIYEYICDGEFKEIIEEEIEIPIENFKFMCENAYNEILINKNLISFLNNKVPLWSPI